MANRLVTSSSPYLRQHADNPVDWWEWSDEAFAEARRRDVPILVSIGYATCHWCHVMAHESFEDAETAALMNRYFVNIKVDREERPDVDAIYMDAVQALHGRGGWPLNAFVDHEGRPFFAAMYFPTERWQGVVVHLGRSWVESRDQVDKSADELTQHLKAMGESRPEAATEGAAALWERFDVELSKRFDAEHPGLGAAPKFPASQVIAVELMRGSNIGRTEAMLEAMQDSGLHDLVGGGFHRYATDRKWRVPHFEKMLYDQAQLLVGFTLGAVRTGREDFWATAEGIADYLVRDLGVVDATGQLLGFASAEDADDPGGEGSFYAWSPQDLHDLKAALEGVGVTAETLIRAWDLAPGERVVGPSGHLEPVERHIPHPRANGLDGVARELGYADAMALRASWQAALPVLRAVRNRRPRPIRDDKVLTDLNGLALEGLAILACHRPRFVRVVEQVSAAMMQRIGPVEVQRLPGRPGYITDYGHLALGLIASFEALGDKRLLSAAIDVVRLAMTSFAHPEGGFYSTPTGGEALIRRSREDSDGAYPSGQHALAKAAVMLGQLTRDGAFSEAAHKVFAVQRGLAERAPTACATLFSALLFDSTTPVTVVIGGDGEEARAMADGARRVLRAALYVLETKRFEAADAAWLPLLEGRLGRDKAEAFVCVGTECLLPLTDVAALRSALERL